MENTETEEKTISKFTVEITVEDGEIRSSVRSSGLTTLELFGVASILPGIVDEAIKDSQIAIEREGDEE